MRLEQRMAMGRALRVVIVGVIVAGAMVVLGICAEPASPPDSATRERAPSSSLTGAPGSLVGDQGEGPSNAVTDTRSGLQAATETESMRKVTVVVHVQDGPSGEILRAQDVSLRTAHDAPLLQLERRGTVYRREGIDLPDAIRLLVTPPAGHVLEAPEVLTADQIDPAAEREYGARLIPPY
jgi:hypothetical protein